LTLKAARLIALADVIVHDGLVDSSILAMAYPKARLISVAKSRSNHSVPQDGINEILIREARAGHLVIRLKGGDPFVFGRGGEEAEACRNAGIDVEVVPGISAAMGCAAQAMLPLTHRDAASAVSFVAGQCKGLTEQDWSGLVGRGRTLVIYMGVATANEISEKLIADGVSPEMPVAVLEKGTRKDMRAMRTLLTDLGDMIVRERVKSPAIIVVGEVVLKSDAVDMLRQYAQRAELEF
jgi:uroporphyrin-III C-methyltransferase